MAQYVPGSAPSPALYRALKWVSLGAVLAVIAVFGTLGYNLSGGYYLGILGALLPFAAYVSIRRRLKAAEIRGRARARWGLSGREVERPEATGGIRAGYLTWTAVDGEHMVDDRTWSDLEMEKVYRVMDICFTDAGSNELFRLLHHCPPPDRETDDRDRLVGALLADNGLRERLLVELCTVGRERDADPATFLWKPVARDSKASLYVGMAAAAVASILLTVVLPTTGLLAAVAVLAINMVLYYRNTRHLSTLIPQLRALSRLMGAATHLESMDLPGVDRERAKTAAGVVPRFRRPMHYLLTGSPGATQTVSGDIFEMVFIYIKIFFAIDLIAYDRIVTLLLHNLDAVRELYRGVGRLDALCAVASYRVHRSGQCAPTRGGGGLTVEGVYHPLLETPVANTVSLPPPGAMITGTNMAGKSTFLRTLGVNAILAQTTGACFARVWKADRYLVMSSIAKHDDPEAGKSFYYDEAERIHGMIESAVGDLPILLLIDELLSGTNSRERTGASVAILRYLARRGALTVAATHDLGIAGRLSDLYPPYYFTDRADENGLSFDYKLRPGIVPSRNAIKLLSLIGYPDDVVSQALWEAGEEGPDPTGSGSDRHFDG